MANEITIPLLPCHSINEMLAFYSILGFDITYQQSRPNNYAVVCREAIELHFFSMPEYVPATSYSSCYIRVLNVDELYQTFTAALRQAYGRLPSAGIPRVIPLKDKTGRREFIIVDPGGNWIRIGQPFNTSTTAGESATDRIVMTKIQRTLQAATLLSEAGHDDRAVRILDAALTQDESAPATERFQLLVYRAGLAINLEDHALARKLLREARQLALREDEHLTLTADFQRADELEHILQ